MDEMRIVFFELTHTWGGIESFLLAILQNIDKKKYSCEFVTSFPNTDVTKSIQAAGGIIHIVSGKRELAKYCVDIRKLLNMGGDFLYINRNSGIDIMPLFLAGKGNFKKIIFHSHNTSPTVQTRLAFLHRLNRHYILKKADTLVACSEKAAEWMFGKNSNANIIYNGIDIGKYRFNEELREKVRREMGLQDCFVIGHVGRFAEAKNHEFLIDIFSKVKKQRMDAKLMLIGKGPLENKIKERAISLGISDSVMFMGYSENVNELMQAMDVFVMPSIHEGFPIACLEAQATGLRCIISDSVTREIVATKHCTMISLDAPKQDWVDAICQNPEERRFELGMTRFDSAEMVRKIEAELLC